MLRSCLFANSLLLCTVFTWVVIIPVPQSHKYMGAATRRTSPYFTSGLLRAWTSHSLRRKRGGRKEIILFVLFCRESKKRLKGRARKKEKADDIGLGKKEKLLLLLLLSKHSNDKELGDKAMADGDIEAGKRKLLYVKIFRYVASYLQFQLPLENRCEINWFAIYEYRDLIFSVYVFVLPPLSQPLAIRGLSLTFRGEDFFRQMIRKEEETKRRRKGYYLFHGSNQIPCHEATIRLQLLYTGLVRVSQIYAAPFKNSIR